jgi:hypothetical protein
MGWSLAKNLTDLLTRFWSQLKLHVLYSTVWRWHHWVRLRCLLRADSNASRPMGGTHTKGLFSVCNSVCCSIPVPGYQPSLWDSKSSSSPIFLRSYTWLTSFLPTLPPDLPLPPPCLIQKCPFCIRVTRTLRRILWLEAPNGLCVPKVTWVYPVIVSLEWSDICLSCNPLCHFVNRLKSTGFYQCQYLGCTNYT